MSQRSIAESNSVTASPVVELYCTLTCPFCRLTRNFLQQNGIPYVEFLVDRDALQYLQMGGNRRRITVPQIFIGGYHVGGYEDIMILSNTGELHRLIESAIP